MRELNKHGNNLPCSSEAQSTRMHTQTHIYVDIYSGQMRPGNEEKKMYPWHTNPQHGGWEGKTGEGKKVSSVTRPALAPLP